MITNTARALPFCITLLASAAACSDDDSSATTSGSSTSTGPDSPTSSSTTVAVTADDTSTGTGTGATSTGTSTATDTGTGTETGTTGTSDGSTASESSTGAGALEIAGEWLEEFAPGMGVTHTIDEMQWDQTADFGSSVFHIDSYDNEARYVVAQGDEANEFFPGLWSRFDWTWDGDALYYCTAVYDADTVEDALAAPASEPGDLEMGCGGFPWSLLMPIR
jgi:hypothetical protein